MDRSHRNVVDIYFQASQASPEHRAFVFSAPGFTQHWTYREIWRKSCEQAERFKKAGVKVNDHVGICAASSWRWEIAQLALLLCGAVVVGLDPNEADKNRSKICQLADLKFIVLEQDFLREKWQSVTLQSVTFLDLYAKVDDLNADIYKKYEASVSSFDPEKDIFIFFTSGTTSEPKGIAYNHRKILLAVERLVELYPEVGVRPRTVCWLPLANPFQRMLNFCSVAKDGEIFFIENPVEVVQHLSRIHPTLFVSVPRFFEKIHDTAMSKIKSAPFPINRLLLFGFWMARKKWTYRHRPVLNRLFEILLKPWDRLVFKKIRGLFGHNLKILLSGSAPIRKELLLFYHSLNLPIFEAYGTSENVIPLAANRSGYFKLGSVGLPVIQGSIMLSSEGEVLVKNDGLFSGYLHRDSSSSFENGYYKTGDLGQIDPDGYLYLVGRKSEMFKTTTGKKVVVSEIESAFKTIPFVDQTVVIGEGRKFPLVMLTIDFTALATYLKKPLQKIWNFDHGVLSKDDVTTVESAVAQVWRNLDIPTKPAGALILTRRFSLENQEITVNLKIRRNAIEKHFQNSFDKLYLEADSEKSTGFPIHFLGSDGKPLQNDVITSPAARMYHVSKIIVHLMYARLVWKLGFLNERQFHRRIGQFLRIGLGGLRGPLQKLGQMLSTLPEDIPREVKEELGQLFRDSNPVNSHLIRSIVEREFSKPLPALFAEWRDIPISTGSVGQVHWARLHSGEEVAVKVLLPGVEHALKSDLRILELVLPILRKVLNFDSLPQHFSELKNLMTSECNLKIEADNFEIFARIFKDDKNVIVPRVHRQFCTEKVLVTDYIDGQSLEEVAQSDDQQRKNKLAEIIWVTASLPINIHSVFNADPHPGNYIVVGDRIAMVDFGFCKKWDNEFITKWKRQVLAGCDNDLEAFEKASHDLGIFNHDNPNFFRQLLEINQLVIYQPWLKDREFYFSQEWVKDYLRALLKYQIRVKGLVMPKEFLALSRLYWGMFNLMALLEARGNFYRATIPYIQQETLGIDGVKKTIRVAQ